MKKDKPVARIVTLLHVLNVISRTEKYGDTACTSDIRLLGRKIQTQSAPSITWINSSIRDV